MYYCYEKLLVTRRKEQMNCNFLGVAVWQIFLFCDVWDSMSIHWFPLWVHSNSQFFYFVFVFFFHFGFNSNQYWLCSTAISLSMMRKKILFKFQTDQDFTLHKMDCIRCNISSLFVLNSAHKFYDHHDENADEWGTRKKIC